MQIASSIENKLTFFGFGFLFFVSDAISKVCFGHFWLLVPDLDPTATLKYFTHALNEN